MGNRASENFETSTDVGNTDGKLFDSGASRRKFLKALAMAGAGAILPGSGLIAQVTSPSVRPLAGRVDIHHHIFPPFYLKAMEEQMRAGGFSPRLRQGLQTRRKWGLKPPRKNSYGLRARSCERFLM